MPHKSSLSRRRLRFTRSNALDRSKRKAVEISSSSRAAMMAWQRDMHNMRSKKKKFNVILCALITSMVFVISGIILIIVRTLIYNKALAEVLTLVPEKKTFEMFKKTPFDTYFDIYFFNWTNPEEFHDLTKKPILKEVGPFRFLEVMEKTNITFHENNTVSYNRIRRWHFVPDGSAFDLDTAITTINPTAVSGAFVLRDQNFIMRKGFSISISSLIGRIDVTKSAGQMLFFGYNDPLMNLARSMPFLSKTPLPPFDKFGWFYKRNMSNSFDGHFNMGINGSTFGQINNWNYENHTSFYKDNCGEVRGSAGEFFPQNLSKGPLGIFNIEMCRTLLMDYDGEHTRSMIKGFKYTLGDHSLDNGSLIPENKCYCNGDCIPYGLMNISSCRYGSPGFVSLPHFYKADPYYRNLVQGLKPTDRHNFYMIIEPTTGIPIEVAARLQINLLVKNVPGITLLSNINDVFFPMLWFEEVVKVPAGLAFALLILLWTREICLLTGIIMVASGVSIMYYTTYKICTTNLCGKKKKKEFKLKELVPLNGEKVR